MIAAQSENGLPCAVVSSPSLVTGIIQEEAKWLSVRDVLKQFITLYGRKVYISPSHLLIPTV